MTAAASKSILPYTYADRLALGAEIRVPATLEEYLEFAEQCEYRVEYSNGQIISMGHPTDTHELNHDYVGLEAAFSFEGRRVSVRQLYRKVIFAERPPHPAR